MPQEIGQILQGTLLLSAVIAFEVVRRYRQRLIVKEAADKTAARTRRSRADGSDAVSADLTSLVTKPAAPEPTGPFATMFTSRPWLRPVAIGCILLALFSFVRIVADAAQAHRRGHLHRRRRASPPRSCWPVSAACSPSVPAS